MGSLLTRLSALGIFALALAGCSGSGSGVATGSIANSGGNTGGGVTPPTGGITGGAGVGSQNALNFTALPTIKIPGVPPPSGVFSWDISFVDTAAGNYYLADRITDGVDVVNLKTNNYVLTAGAGAFTRLGTTPPTPATNGGPNGIVPVPGGLVFAGDGDSTTKVVNINTGALVATLPNTNPISAANLATYSAPASNAFVGVPAGSVQTALNTLGCNTPTTGAANRRADEMAYDPVENIVMVVNDASCPPFAVFFNAAPPFNMVGSLPFVYANAGAEQPVYDPIQKVFLMALPATVQNPGGEIDVINPKTYQITNVYGEPNCNANGIILGKGETLFLGCASTNVPQQTVTMNAADGSIMNVIPNLGGNDMVTYNPALDRFYGAASNNKVPGPVIIIADGTGRLITTIPTSVGAHSVSVDPATEHIFVPQRATGLTVFGH